MVIYKHKLNDKIDFDFKQEVYRNLLYTQRINKMKARHDTSLKLDSYSVKDNVEAKKRSTKKRNRKRVNIILKNDGHEELESSDQGKSRPSIQHKDDNCNEDNKCHVPTNELFEFTKNSSTDIEINNEHSSCLNENDQSFIELDKINCNSIKLHDNIPVEHFNTSDYDNDNQHYCHNMDNDSNEYHELSKELFEATTNNSTGNSIDLEILRPMELSYSENIKELQTDLLTLSMEQIYKTAADSDAKLLQASPARKKITMEKMKLESNESSYEKESLSFDCKISIKLESKLELALYCLQSNYNLLIERHMDRFKLLSTEVSDKETKLLNKIRNISL